MRGLKELWADAIILFIRVRNRTARQIGENTIEPLLQRMHENDGNVGSLTGARSHRFLASVVLSDDCTDASAGT